MRKARSCHDLPEAGVAVNCDQRTRENINHHEGNVKCFRWSIKPASRFNYINVAIWENEEVYWKAYEKSVTPMKAKLQQLQVEMTPALYHVAFEY
jgi:heme oxygenase (mycobilin-producing)